MFRRRSRWPKGVSIGTHPSIDRTARLETWGGSITIGDRCFIGPSTVLYGHGGLIIGDDVLIAAHVVVIPANHRFDRQDVPIREQGETRRGITIENDVWIGAHATILDGVTVGQGAIVAAGAVVNRDVAPNMIAGGVPARALRPRFERAGRAYGRIPSSMPLPGSHSSRSVTL